MSSSAKTSRAIAIDILSRRDHSVREMKQKLRKKGILPEDSEQVIDWLIQKKLLDDHAFAQKKAESIFRTKLVGPKYIESKLREAGIAGDISETAIENLATNEDWNIKAMQALERWQNAHPKHKDDKIRKMRFLASRGFNRTSI